MQWLIDYKEKGSEEIIPGLVSTLTGSKVEAIKAIEKSGQYKVVRLERAAENHRCPYCGEITEGTYAKLLCKECRELFGHSTYDEL